MKLNEIRFSFELGTVHWIFDDHYAPSYRVVILCLDDEKTIITTKQPTIINSRNLLERVRNELGKSANDTETWYCVSCSKPLILKKNCTVEDESKLLCYECSLKPTKGLSYDRI